MKSLSGVAPSRTPTNLTISRLALGTLTALAAAGCINIEADQRAPAARPAATAPSPAAPGARTAPETERVLSNHGPWAVRTHSANGRWTRCTASKNGPDGMLRLHILAQPAPYAISLPTHRLPVGKAVNVSYGVGTDRWAVQSGTVGSTRVGFATNDAILKRIEQGGTFVASSAGQSWRWDIDGSVRPAVDAMRLCAARKPI